MRRADGRPAGNGKHKTGTGIAGRPVRDLLVDYLGNARYNQAGVAVLRLPGSEDVVSPAGESDPPPDSVSPGGPLAGPVGHHGGPRGRHDGHGVGLPRGRRRQRRRRPRRSGACVGLRVAWSGSFLGVGLHGGQHRLGSGCVRWRPGGCRSGAQPCRRARPTGSPTRARRPNSQARSPRQGRLGNLDARTSLWGAPTIGATATSTSGAWWRVTPASAAGPR
jgi:hypothetical protein